MDKDKYIGRLLDNRYEILEVIGTGGMAVVYKARCHRLNRLVAVKILKDDNLEDEDFRRRFHAESQAVAMLSHPNIVSVYDVSTSVMADYIVMELIEGITLKQYMEKKGVLNWKETLHFAMQIAKALEHAHSKGIVHRDIKPHNVMVLKNGSVKVMDFGIARLISRGNTLTKEALGSVHYISPEQARGGRIDDRSDLYSLGVVMYEMMAGRPPYDGESPVAIAIQHINGGAALPSVLNPNIPGGLEQIIMKAMAKNVSERYPSATRMLADMDEFRKDPTILFDYTGLPIDASIRMQKPVTVPAEDATAGKGMPELKSRGGNHTGGVPKQTPQPRRESQPHREPQKRKRPVTHKRSRSTTTAIVVCSLVAVIAIGIFMALLLGGGLTPSEKLVTVPALVGKNYADIDSIPECSRLIIMKHELYDESVPAGQIISQKPEANKQIVENSRVMVTVSLGPVPHVITMPPLQGKTQEEAEALLKSLGLIPVIEPEYNKEVAKGIVIRSTPAAGDTLSQGQNVTLVVSQGKKVEISSMPNVVSMEQNEALIKLKEYAYLDLQPVVEEIFDPNFAVGYVIKTDPGPGEKLETNDTVILYVSKGVESKVLPSFEGVDLNKAKADLKSLGFLKDPVVKYVASKEAKDTVISQSLKEGVAYELSAEIELEVSDGSLMPETVIKDVIIDLRGRAQYSRCKVSIKRDGVEVHMSTVPKGTGSVTLPAQEGGGTVFYTVLIDDSDGWIHEEFFSMEVAPSANG